LNGKENFGVSEWNTGSVASAEAAAYRDRPLTFRWLLPDDLLARLRLPAPRNSAFEAARSMLLAEVLLAAENGQRVSYSRRKVFYSRAQRYRSRAYTYSTVMAAVDELVAHGWLHEHRVKPNHRGWQSSIWATSSLLEAARASRAELAYHAGEPIRLKDAAGDLMDYTDTRQTIQLRRALERINDGLKQVRIDLPGAERRGRHLCFGDASILPLPGNGLYRIFGRGDFGCHGRAYGWWQNIPRTARRDLLIDEEPTAEADFAAFHATMLYCQLGVKFDGDPYDVEGFERGHVKKGFNIALNAQNRRSAVYSLSDKVGITVQEAARLLDAVEHRHKPIGDAFFSDAGVRLMRADSDVILAAVAAANAHGFGVLPIHDALVAPARYIDVAAEKMVEAFEKTVGRANPCRVGIKRSQHP
jgi:hypothetical protein